MTIIVLFQCVQGDRLRAKNFRTLSDFSCKPTCRSCTFCCGASTNERFKSYYCKGSKVIKVCERGFLCLSIEFCTECEKKCPSWCSRSTCRGQIAPILGNMGNPEGQSQGYKDLQRRLHPPLLDPTKFDKVTDHYEWLCTSSQEQLPDRGITCTYAM